MGKTNIRLLASDVNVSDGNPVYRLSGGAAFAKSMGWWCIPARR